MRELPAGTVTFLFTDIEGSTRLWEEHPDAMQIALAHHDAALSSAIEAHSGALVKTTGDGIHAAFPTANDALAAAVAMQRALAAESFDGIGPLRVRMGTHTCEAEMRDGDYYGSGVNRAARLMSVAHGGQIVVSAVTAALCDDRIEMVDLGEHRLRDLSRAERVWQVDVDGERFPHLRSLDNLPGNLPLQLTEFIGHADDVASVAKALEDHRVVTLTGVGGVGKTRLALQVAAEIADRFRHGTWFCDLAPVASPDRIAPTIADAMGIDAGTTDPEGELATRLRHQEALVVVDNCEHLLEEAARVVEHLARECPNVTILATSREGLGSPGEQILAVRSLAQPAADDPAADIVESEAVRLFLDRARSVRADLALDDRSLAAIGEISRRLDGIPLAIELAAARVQSMTAVEISERLDQRFRLLKRGGRVALGRQHTLQTAVDWSYQLLDDAERTVLARSSVFAGGFTLAAAERVVATDDIDPFDVLDLLGSLVRRSMLVADERDGATRYRLLETIRQFAFERLDADGDVDDARAAHLAWCRSFMIDCAQGMLGPEAIAWARCLDGELDNWRTALGFATDEGDLDALADLIGSVPVVALYGTRTGNAFAAAAADVHEAVGEPPHRLTGSLLALIAHEQYLRGELGPATETGLRAVTMGDLHATSNPLFPWGLLFVSAYFDQNFELALAAADEHVKRGTKDGDDYSVTVGHGLRALTFAALGHVEDTRRAAAIASDLLARCDAPMAEMQVRFMVGAALISIGDEPSRQRVEVQRSLELAVALANAFFTTSALAFLDAPSGDNIGDAEQLRSALELLRTLAHREAARNHMFPVVRILLQAGRPAGAAIISGTTRDFGSRNVQFQAQDEEMLAALGRPRYDTSVARGRGLTIDEALAFAIAELDAIIAGET